MQLRAEEEVPRAVDQLLEAASLRGRDAEDLRLLGESSRLAHAARVGELGGGQFARGLAAGAAQRAQQREQEDRDADDDPGGDRAEEERRGDEGQEARRGR